MCSLYQLVADSDSFGDGPQFAVLLDLQPYSRVFSQIADIRQLGKIGNLKTTAKMITYITCK